MKNKIIAVDFDGTLCENNFPDIGDPKKHVIARIKKEQREGAKIILWTCRSGELLTAAVYWCAKRGLIFDAINENLLETEAEMGHDTRKVCADEYWDDRAVYPLDLEYTTREIKEFNLNGARAFSDTILDHLKERIKDLNVFTDYKSLTAAIREDELSKVIEYIKDLTAGIVLDASK